MEKVGRAIATIVLVSVVLGFPLARVAAANTSDAFMPTQGRYHNSYAIYGVTPEAKTLQGLKVDVTEVNPTLDELQLSYYLFTPQRVYPPASPNSNGSVPVSHFFANGSYNFDKNTGTIIAQDASTFYSLTHADWSTWHLVLDDNNVHLDLTLNRGPIYTYGNPDTTPSIINPIVNMDAMDTLLQGTYVNKLFRSTESISGYVDFDHWVTPVISGLNVAPSPCLSPNFYSFYEVTYWIIPTGVHGTVYYSGVVGVDKRGGHVGTTIPDGIVKNYRSPTGVIGLVNPSILITSSWTVTITNAVNYTSSMIQSMLETQNGTQLVNAMTQGALNTSTGTYRGNGYLEYALFCIPSNVGTATSSVSGNATTQVTGTTTPTVPWFQPETILAGLLAGFLVIALRRRIRK